MCAHTYVFVSKCCFWFPSLLAAFLFHLFFHPIQLATIPTMKSSNSPFAPRIHEANCAVRRTYRERTKGACVWWNSVTNHFITMIFDRPLFERSQIKIKYKPEFFEKSMTSFANDYKNNYSSKMSRTTVYWNGKGAIAFVDVHCTAAHRKTIDAYRE